MNLSRAVSFLRVGPTIIQEFMEIESSSIISLVDSIRCSVHAHGRFVPEKAEKSRKEKATLVQWGVLIRRKKEQSSCINCLGSCRFSCHTELNWPINDGSENRYLYYCCHTVTLNTDKLSKQYSIKAGMTETVKVIREKELRMTAYKESHFLEVISIHALRLVIGTIR